MGVYIKGIEMPENCPDCFLVDYCSRNGVKCLSKYYNGRPQHCYVVDVKMPHGDMIDAHFLKVYFANLYEIAGAQADDKVFSLLEIYKQIDRFTKTSTVIEAEE